MMRSGDVLAGIAQGLSSAFAYHPSSVLMAFSSIARQWPERMKFHALTPCCRERRVSAETLFIAWYKRVPYGTI